MRRHSATKGTAGVDVFELDADGVSSGPYRVSLYGPHAMEAGRLLALALSLPGSLPEAVQIVRAALIRAESGEEETP